MARESTSIHENFFDLIGLSKDAQFATQAVRLGGRRLLQFHRSEPQALQIKYKDDATAVTVADEQSERIMTRFVEQKYPGVRIWGEEEGISGNKDAKTTIYIDPLDGTNPYTHGERFSTVGFAKREGQETTLSAICLPFEREVMVAEKGKGAWLFPLDDELRVQSEPKQMHVSAQPDFTNVVAHFDANWYPNVRWRKLDTLGKIFQAAPDSPFSTRNICSNVGQQAEVAAGRGDLTVTDCVGGPYDFFAGELLITEAGGSFTDQYGNPVSETTQLAIGSNGLLHDRLMNIVKETYDGFEGFRNPYDGYVPQNLVHPSK